MKLVTSFSILALAGALASPVQGQAIVDATGLTAGSVQTITEALNGTESEIIVKNTGVYQEALMITRDVVLRGEDPANRPVVALKGNPTQPAIGTGDGIYAGGTVGGTANLNIEIRNFIFIPNLDGSISDDGFSVTPNVGAVLNFTMDNVLCAPNDGTDKPLATSVWDNPSGGTRVPGAWFYLMDNSFGGFDGDINTSVTNCNFIGAGTDATVFYPGEGGSVYISKIGTSYSGRYSTQISYNIPVTITGSKEEPSWVARKNVSALIVWQGGDVKIDNMIAIDNGNTGIRVDSDTVDSLLLADSLFANNLTQGFFTPYAATVPKTWTIANCTFLNNGTPNSLPNIQITNLDGGGAADSSLLTLNIVDSIIAGAAGHGIQNLNALDVFVINSALVTEGPHALATTFSGDVTLSNVINSDPLFASIDTDPLVEDSFDVTAVQYGTAASTGGNLNGWGEGPSASVGEWSLY